MIIKIFTISQSSLQSKIREVVEYQSQNAHTHTHTCHHTSNQPTNQSMTVLATTAADNDTVTIPVYNNGDVGPSPHTQAPFISGNFHTHLHVEREAKKDAGQAFHLQNIDPMEQNGEYRKDNSSLLHHHHSKNDDSSVYGIHLDRYSPTVQYLVLATFIFLFYVMSGIAQEALFTAHPGFQFGFFITLFRFAFNAVLASHQFYSAHRDTLPITNEEAMTAAEAKKTKSVSVRLKHGLASSVRQILGLKRRWWHNTEIRTPLSVYVLTAALTVLGIGLGNQSLSYLNFPTKALFKSSKLLFVMAFGFVVLGKRYSRWDYVASLQLILGLIMLYLANVTVSISLDIVGLGLMIASLVCDAVIGNLYEKILQHNGSTATEMLFFINLIGSVIALFICIISSQFFEAIAFCFKQPMVIVYMMVCAQCAFII